MRDKIFAAVLLCAVLLGSACCGGAPAVGMTAGEIRDEAIAADTELDTCQFDMDMTMVMWMTMEGITAEVTMAVDAESAIDKPGEKMYMDMDMIMRMTGEEDMEMSTGIYIVDDWMYIGMAIPPMPEMWMKALLEVGDWEEHDIAWQQLDILLDAGVGLLGTETVDGTECYVVDVTPDIEKLWRMMKLMGAEEGLPLELDIEQVLSDFSVRQWIAKDTYFIRKTTVELTMELTPESLGIPSWLAGDFEATADMAMTGSMHHINEPVTIELPPEAAEAEEVPLFY